MLKSAKPFLLQLFLAFQAWALPRENPFVAGAMRALARRNMAIRLAFWFALWFLVAWGIAVSTEDATLHKVNECVVGVETAIGLSWVWAFCTARVRLSSTLQREWLKERLIPILLSPMSPEEVAAKSGAGAGLLGFFVCALALPAWALGLGLGFLNGRDAWGFTLLLLVACVGFPTWSSASWEAQLNARALAKAGVTQSGKRKVATNSTPPQTEASVSGALLLSVFPLISALGCTVPEQFASSIGTWVSMWPPEITALFGQLYAVPLLLARLLAYPLPFFCGSLPLWIALAPFWVSALRASHARLSSSLEARAGSADKRARRLAQIWRPTRGWWAPLLAGFALPVAYESHWLAAWRGSTPIFPSKAGVEADVTLAWWHIVIAMGTFTLSIWLRQRAAKCGQDGMNWNELLARFWKLARRGGAVAFGAGVLGPLLCGHNPFPLSFPLFSVQMALVAGTWLTLQLALGRANSTGNKGYEQFPLPKWLRWIVVLWLVGGPLLLAGGSFAWTWGASVVNPLSWPFCLMSPTTLWFAPRFEQSLHSPLFYGAATLHFALAGLLWMRARTLRAPVVAVTRKLVDARRRTLAAFQMVLKSKRSPDLAQGRVPRNPVIVADTGAFSADAVEINTPQTAALRTATRLPIPSPTPEQERFLNRCARDNALLRLELRRAMGKTGWTTTARAGAAAGVFLVIFFSILLPCCVVAIDLLTGPPTARAGSQLTFAGMEWVFSAITAFSLVLTCVDVAQRTSTLYDRDRLDGSLDFLFLTPLETRSIVAGKILPSLLRGACFVAAFWPCLFTISLLLSLGGDFRLWPFALLAPLLAWALTARAIAWMHLASVAKPNSKVAYFTAHAGLFAFPIVATIAAILAAPDGFLPTHWEVPVALLASLLIPGCLLDCLWPLLWSVRLLQRERVRR